MYVLLPLVVTIVEVLLRVTMQSHFKLCNMTRKNKRREYMLFHY